jgi:hypothetical protein
MLHFSGLQRDRGRLAKAGQVFLVGSVFLPFQVDYLVESIVQVGKSRKPSPKGGCHFCKNE